MNSVLNLKSQNFPGLLHEYAVWVKGNKKICFLKNLLRTPEAGIKAHNCDNTHEAEAEAGGLLQTQGKLGCIAIPSFLKTKQDETKRISLYKRKGKLIKIRGLLIINNLNPILPTLIIILKSLQIWAAEILRA